MDFLDEFFRPMLKNKKRRVIKSNWEIEYEKRNKKYYARLNRLIKKHNITLYRSQSYWDFCSYDNEGISIYRTIGLNDDIEDYITAYKFVKEQIEDGTFFELKTNIKLPKKDT